jgi:MarR family transcriptional regulator, transcriptional regulator for hemolysin
MFSGMIDYHSDPLFLLHDAARLLRVEFDCRARAYGMTRAQWVILAWLERQPGLSQRELANVLDVEPITVARLVDRLETRGMVERRADPTDRRIWRLHLRPEAEPVLTQIAQHRAEVLQTVTAGLDPAAQTALVSSLQHMKAALSAERRAAKEVA